jgi:hypothetical protein
VSREGARRGSRLQYAAYEADHQAWESALRPKACLLAVHRKLPLLEISERLTGSHNQVSKSLYYLLSKHPLFAGEGDPPIEAGKVVPCAQVQVYGKVISQFGWSKLRLKGE